MISGPASGDELPSFAQCVLHRRRRLLRPEAVHQNNELFRTSRQRKLSARNLVSQNVSWMSICRLSLK